MKTTRVICSLIWAMVFIAQQLQAQEVETDSASKLKKLKF